jgi:hypothetical protein
MLACQIVLSALPLQVGTPHSARRGCKAVAFWLPRESCCLSCYCTQRRKVTTLATYCGRAARNGEDRLNTLPSLVAGRFSGGVGE